MAFSKKGSIWVHPVADITWTTCLCRFSLQSHKTEEILVGNRLFLIIWESKPHVVKNSGPTVVPSLYRKKQKKYLLLKLESGPFKIVNMGWKKQVPSNKQAPSPRAWPLYELNHFLSYIDNGLFMINPLLSRALKRGFCVFLTTNIPQRYYLVGARTFLDINKELILSV